MPVLACSGRLCSVAGCKSLDGFQPVHRYIDPTGKVQGPFFAADMIEWFKAVRVLGNVLELSVAHLPKQGRTAIFRPTYAEQTACMAGTSRLDAPVTTVARCVAGLFMPASSRAARVPIICSQGYLKDMELPTVGTVRAAGPVCCLLSAAEMQLPAMLPLFCCTHFGVSIQASIVRLRPGLLRHHRS